MSRHDFRCGTSAVVHSPVSVQNVPRDRDPVRLRTRLHMPATRPAPAEFRLLGVSPRGVETLICLAATYAQALRRLPAHAAGFSLVRLERWQGTRSAGRWRTVAVRHRRQKPRRASVVNEDLSPSAERG